MNLKTPDIILGFNNTEIKLFNWNADSCICHPCYCNDLIRSIQLKRKWRKFSTAVCLHNLSRKKSWCKGRKIHLPIACYQELWNWVFPCNTTSSNSSSWLSTQKMDIINAWRRLNWGKLSKHPNHNGAGSILTFDACRSHRRYSVKLSKQM